MSGAAAPTELTALVADDEALARRRIVELLSRRKGIRLIGQCGTGTATLDAVRELSPDVLFLDVQMPGLTGFEVLARLPEEERPVVVFSTAFDEYALAAFEVHAVDYLLKPFADERFEESVQRAERAVRSERVDDLQHRLQRLIAQVAGDPAADRQTGGGPRPEQPFLDRFAVPGRDGLVIVPAAEVNRIEAAGDYVRLHTGAGSHLLRATMAALEDRLDPARFLRVHRSAIVRLEGVRELRTDSHGAYVAVLDDGTRIRVGRRYRDALLERLGTRW